MKTEMHYKPYMRLLAMTVFSFVAMYLFMYAMVNSIFNVIPNLNQFYMAGLMASPMVIFELWLMSAMYPDKTRNIMIIAASALALILFWTGIRQQSAINDEQFLKSMIPHHAGAILMCEEASTHDPEIKSLCSEIVSNQQSEINQMKRILKRLEAKR